EGELAVRHRAHRRESRGIEMRERLREIQPAVGGEAFEEDRGEGPGGGAAAGGDVQHYERPSSSRRMRVILPVTTGSASIFAIAAFTFFSRAGCVSMMMSTCSSPSLGSRWIMASIEIDASASTRVMSASTPGRSNTRM